MVQNSQAHKNLMHQLKEAYGRVVYTFTTHNKCIQRLASWKKWLNRIEISLTAISTTGFISVIVSTSESYQDTALVVSTFISTALLVLRLLNFNNSIEIQISQHSLTGHQLWRLREEYISLMTDFLNGEIDLNEAMQLRNNLSKQVGQIYKEAPLTNSKCYKLAQKALKYDEEQFFSEEELQKMLPPHLR